MAMTEAADSAELQNRHLVLGLSGGIACYKSAELVRLLVKAGATVQVVMTEAAEHFITATTMQALSGRRNAIVYSDNSKENWIFMPRRRFAHLSNLSARRGDTRRGTRRHRST